MREGIGAWPPSRKRPEFRESLPAYRERICSLWHSSSDPGACECDLLPCRSVVKPEWVASEGERVPGTSEEPSSWRLSEHRQQVPRPGLSLGLSRNVHYQLFRAVGLCRWALNL